MTHRPLTTSSNGYDLRVWHLSEALATQEDLVLLHFPAARSQPPGITDLQPQRLFCKVVETPALECYKPRFRRHFRTREDQFFRWGYPDFQAAVVQQIDALCAAFAIGTIIVFGANLAGLVRDFSGKKKVLLDVCDSMALTLERGLLLDNWRARPREFLRDRLMLNRWSLLEGCIPDWFDQVVTINAMDTAKLRQLSGRTDNLVTVGNGVSGDLCAAYRELPPQRRGVAFWGNLAFPPNRDAVNFFYHEVYLPWLKPAGIEFCIVGPDAEDWLVEAAAHDPGLRLTGYVDDLRTLLITYPIMVNPMRIGSGLKNKVLEAHAIGLAVVSTRLGIESVEGAAAGESFLVAEEPVHFFDAIRTLLENESLRIRLLRAARSLLLGKYTWEIIGAQWIALVRRLEMQAS